MSLSWLLLVYKIPPEPSANRVYVWRRLKTLGALLLHDAVWVLPAADSTREQFQWLAAEIMERGGEALVWEAGPPLMGQNDALMQRFTDQVDHGYREILNALGSETADLVALSQRYQQITRQDYFGSPLGQQVRQALIQARGEDTT